MKIGPGRSKRAGQEVSSPRTRGCSRRPRGVGLPADVLPAHAGLFPAAAPRPSSRLCPPRARGAVPSSTTPPACADASSPRTRGCSLPRHDGGGLDLGPPRARGAVPPPRRRRNPSCMSSPRTRGCSHGEIGVGVVESVLPAHAGLFPPQSPKPPPKAGPPRARGAVPAWCERVAGEHGSSPRTRGCSLLRRRLRPVRRRPPRARGAVPHAGMAVFLTGQSSPRTRGCSGQDGGVGPFGQVLPAHAGLFPAAYTG